MFSHDWFKFYTKSLETEYNGNLSITKINLQQLNYEYVQILSALLNLWYPLPPV